MNVRVLFSFLYLLSIQIYPAAQVVLKGKPDRTAIRVGDTVTLQVEASYPSGTPVKWSIPDTLPHWEWLDKAQPGILSNGSMTTQFFQCRFTGYDTGFWPLPTLAILAGSKWVRLDSPFVSVRYANEDLAPAFREIKPLIDLPEENSLVALWLIGAGVLSLAALIYYIFFVRKRTLKKETTTGQKSIPYFLHQLELMQRAFGRGEITEKELYDRWFALLHASLDWKMRWSVPYSSARLLAERIAGADLPAELKEQLKESILVAETVRFARFQPEGAVNDRTLSVLKRLLDHFH
jgi:hypothetical protein